MQPSTTTPTLPPRAFTGWCRRLTYLCAVLCCLAVAPKGAKAEDALDKIIYLDIPAKTLLEDALIDWGTKASVAVMINTQDVANQRIPGIRGTFRARDALAELLQDSGLIFTQNGARIRVLPRSSLVTSSLYDVQRATDAQTDSEQTTPSASTDGRSIRQATANSPEIQEVVVSAQRRDETIERVPISMTAFSQSTLDDLHVQSLSDLATITPGLLIPPPGPGGQSLTNIIIRGIISNNNSPTTGVYIDDTSIVVRQMQSIGFSSTPQPQMFDLDRIEVLRGPQGTLFGSDAMGGAIRYITPTPSLEHESGYAKVQIGYTDRGAPSYQIGVAYGAPITAGTLGFRMSAYFHSDGGFVDLEDPYTGQFLNRNINSSHTMVLRPAFAVKPVDDLTITPAVFIQRQHSSAPTQIWFTQLPTPDTGAFATGFGRQASQPFQDNLTVSSLAIKYRFSGLTVASDTSYLDRSYTDVDDYSNIVPALLGVSPTAPALSAFYAYDKNLAKTRAWQQEFHVSSEETDASRFSWIAGAYYRHSIDHLTQYVGPSFDPVTEYGYGLTLPDILGVPYYVLNGQTYASFGISEAVTVQTALFGNVSVRILPQLKATVGLRVERSAVQSQTQTLAGPLDATAYTVIRLPDQLDHPVTPRFSLAYEFSDDGTIYVAAAKGFRSGGSNSPTTTNNPSCGQSIQQYGLAAVPTTFSSDSLWSYEIGAKGSFFDRRLSIQSSLFRINWSNIQSSVLLPSCGQTYTTNQGKVISQGFDLQLAAVPIDGFKLSASVGYTNAFNPNTRYGPPDPTTGQVPVLSVAGDKVMFGPPWTASGVLEYSLNIAPLWDAARSYLRFEDRWQAGLHAQYPRAGYDPDVGPYPDEAYNIINVRLGVTHGGLDLSIFGENLTNANPRLSYGHTVPGDPLFYGVALRPVTFGLTAIHRF